MYMFLRKEASYWTLIGPFFYDANRLNIRRGNIFMISSAQILRQLFRSDNPYLS